MCWSLKLSVAVTLVVYRSGIADFRRTVGRASDIRSGIIPFRTRSPPAGSDMLKTGGAIEPAGFGRTQASTRANAVKIIQLFFVGLTHVLYVHQTRSLSHLVV